ncbi:MAG TPA: hypothetical protein VJ464_30570 [Blastocatellia bacterium]|nr:hypothetical protein [Blastocatellia bacterium]
MFPYVFAFIENEEEKAFHVKKLLADICEVRPYIYPADEQDIEAALTMEAPPFAMLGLDFSLDGGSSPGKLTSLRYLHRFRERFPSLDIIMISSFLKRTNIAGLIDDLRKLQPDAPRIRPIPQSYWVEREKDEATFRENLTRLVISLFEGVASRENLFYDCAILIEKEVKGGTGAILAIGERHTRRCVHIELAPKEYGLFQAVTADHARQGNQEKFSAQEFTPFFDKGPTKLTKPEDRPREVFYSINAKLADKVEDLIIKINLAGEIPPQWMLNVKNGPEKYQLIPKEGKDQRWLNACVLSRDEFANLYGSGAVFRT